MEKENWLTHRTRRISVPTRYSNIRPPRVDNHSFAPATPSGGFKENPFHVHYYNEERSYEPRRKRKTSVPAIAFSIQQEIPFEHVGHHAYQIQHYYRHNLIVCTMNLLQQNIVL